MLSDLLSVSLNHLVVDLLQKICLCFAAICQVLPLRKRLLQRWRLILLSDLVPIHSLRRSDKPKDFLAIYESLIELGHVLFADIFALDFVGWRPIAAISFVTVHMATFDLDF